MNGMIRVGDGTGQQVGGPMVGKLMFLYLHIITVCLLLYAFAGHAHCLLRRVTIPCSAALDQPLVAHAR